MVVVFNTRINANGEKIKDFVHLAEIYYQVI